MNSETQLLLELCRTPLSPRGQEDIARSLAAGVDWDRLFSRAEAWEIEPVVMMNLRLYFSDLFPSEILERAASRERDARSLMLTRTLILVDLTSKLESAGIDSIVLKGPSAGILAYGDSSLRAFADLDLLVRRSDLAAARDTLVSLGYKPSYDLLDEAALIENQDALEFGGSSLKVELHWSLISRHLRLNLAEEALWTSAQRLECAGASIAALGHAHNFLFLCAHGAKHEWERVRWVCDVAQYADRLDESEVEKILTLARAVHAERLLALAIHLTRNLFADSARLFPVNAFSGQGDTDRLVEHVRRRLGLEVNTVASSNGWMMRIDPGLPAVVFWMRARERLVDRVACVARLVFVPTRKDRGIGPVRWLARPVRLAIKAARRLA